MFPQVEARKGLDGKYVVGVLMTSESVELAGRWAQGIEARGWGEYRYGLVMEAGDRNLMTALAQERLDIEQGYQVYSMSNDAGLDFHYYSFCLVISAVVYRLRHLY